MSYERADTSEQRRARTIRWAVLGAVLVGMTAIVTAHQYVSGSGKPPSADALCPFGGVESLLSLITGAGFLKRTAMSSLILLVGTVGMTLLSRRSFCGQVCPLGTLQGVFGTLGRRLRRMVGLEKPWAPHLAVPLDRVARLLKYAVLAIFAVWSWNAAELVMRPYDPWAAWAHLTTDELLVEFGIGTAVLGLSLVGSLASERFFCKYLCPTGAMLGLFSRVSALRIQRDEEACVECARCEQACPMGVDVAHADTVTSSECISCGECINTCPVAGALHYTAPHDHRVKPQAVTLVIVGAMVGLIALTTWGGLFSWRMPSLAEAIEQSGGSGGDREATTDDPAGGTTFDTGLIRGYMSMAEISEATGIPRAAFVEAFGVPEAELDRPMKEIKDTYGFSPDAVRVWVADELSR